MGILSENMILLPKEVPTGTSLRLDDDRNTYLTRKPTVPGDRQTWTFSCWVKRANIYDGPHIFGAVGLGHGRLQFNHGNSLEIDGSLSFYLGNVNTGDLDKLPQITGDFLMWDTSSWYHVVAVADMTNETESDRMRLYLNGTRMTTSKSINLIENFADGALNSTTFHTIGTSPSSVITASDQYLKDVQFVDGHIKEPSDFGESNMWGQWVHKKYEGVYGTNGFYLPINPITTNEHFAAQTYTGTGTAAGREVGGLGFTPDLVWIKNRTGDNSSRLTDSVRGNLLSLASDSPQGEFAALTTLAADGFDLGDGNQAINTISNNYVAWCWEAPDDFTSTADGDRLASVGKKNDDLGFSIVSYEGTGTAGTVAHGLDVAPEMVIVKNREDDVNWMVAHSGLNGGVGDNDYYLLLNTSADQSNAGTSAWNGGPPTEDLFSLGTNDNTNGSGKDLIAYCFASKTGISQVGSYTGNGSTTGPIVDFDNGGFRPAYILIKGIDGGTHNDNWSIFDSARASDNPNPVRVWANVTSVDGQTESYSTTNAIRFTDTGFQPSGTAADTNASGTTYIYLAFADTSRDGDVGSDHQPGSGTKNNWTPVNVQPYDVVPDTPENTFCTINPVSETLGSYVPSQYPRPSYSEGNLRVSGEFSTDDANSDWTNFTSANVWCNMSIPETGKWYFEFKRGKNNSVGFMDYYNFTRDVNVPAITQLRYLESYSGGVFTSVANDGVLGDMPESNDTLASGFQISDDVTTGASGDIIAHDNPDIWAWGIDTSGEVTLWLNGIVVFSDPSRGQYISRNITVSDGSSGYSGFAHFNFGQDSTFSGSESNSTGFTDSNGIGDFVYQPPAGYLALCTANLPEPDVIPDEHFNTILYEGTGANSVNAINTVGFQPDLVWLKDRFLNQVSPGYNHYLYDSIRGTSQLIPNGTDVENDTGEFLSFDSQGFTLGAVNGLVNDVGSGAEGNVAWCWKAGGAAVTNTEGNNLYIASSEVSANIKAGFSIITYTGDGINESSIGHGLDSTPELIVIKNRGESTGTNWPVYHKDLGIGANSFTNNLDLMSNAGVDNGDIYTNVGPSTFGVRDVISSGLLDNTYVAYCWHSVPGYSKIGSYAGNSSTDGPFIYTGFKPAYVMLKNTAFGSWWIFDTARESFNVMDSPLYADLPLDEVTSSLYDFDIVSNGFKLRSAHAQNNTTGNTYIYMAFAETPLKHTNAR